MNDRLRVVSALTLPSSFPASHFDGRIELELTDGDEKLNAAVRRADVLYGFHIPDFVPAETPRLRWIQLPSAGANDLIGRPVWTSDVVITASKGIHTVPMSEHLFAMLLALVRHVPALVRAQDRREWAHRSGLEFDELRGKTMGILGWGKIGDGIAHLARAFGMRVVGTRFSTTEPGVVPRDIHPFLNPPYLEPLALEPDMVYPSDDLHEVLRQSDVVVSILPLTERTHGLVGDAEFEAMKRGALFCNIGRGAVVDEEALLRALRSGQLGGAGLDVFAEEPLSESSPLWSLENVVVSPHVGGFGSRTLDRAAGFFAVNLERYLQGQPLLNVVDRGREY